MCASGNGAEFRPERIRSNHYYSSDASGSSDSVDGPNTER